MKAGKGRLTMPSSPRVLATGFSVFPGAPVNPTEALMTRWQAQPPAIEGMGAFRAETLAVEYAGMGDRLSAIGASFAPDIAVHFGLAHAARGFRLERIARNSLVNARPDNAGCLPASSTICAGPETFASTLPLETIAGMLDADGLPVEWSDDAGGYLCNMVFALSLAGVCDGFAPAITGFVHVPALAGTELAGNIGLTLDELDRGGRLILEACVQACRTDI
jgi:pyroglutamyl-peptidase